MTYRHRLTPEQIASRLGMRTGRFYSWVNSYRVPHGYAPNADGSAREVMRFSWPEVQAWLATRPDLASKLTQKETK